MILEKALTEQIIGAAIEVHKHFINFNVPVLKDGIKRLVL